MKTAFWFFVIGVLALGLYGNAAAQETIRVAIYGDSLMSGYELQPEQAFPARLEQKLKAAGLSNATVINMSVDSATTADGVDRLGALLEQRPDIVILELGMNDAKRGIGIELVYNNLVDILSKLVLQNKIYVILVGSKAPTRMGFVYVKRFQDMYPRLAQSFNTPLYPYALEGIAGSQTLNLADGLHPNAKGVMLMVEHIYPLVDAAVRWKWEVHEQYQQWLMQGDQEGMSPPPPPPSVTP